MKTGICLLILSLAFVGCRSHKPLMSARSGYVFAQPAQLNVQETIQDTLVVETQKPLLRQEKVTCTSGVELMDYCIIVGSFAYQQNAINLRNDLMRQGFIESSIMQNSEGMYRVSLFCRNNLAKAQNELERIRLQSSRFRDAWLLSVKE